MDENNTINTLLNAELPSSVDNALKNLTDKPSLSIGTTFADLWDLIFGNISKWSEKARIKRDYDIAQYREKLTASINEIPSEKFKEPSIQITAQALEHSKYCISEEELQNMFVSLISNSMNTDFSDYVHPSFSEMIKQMSILDAKIIALFKNISLPGLPVCQYCVNIPNISSGTIVVPEHIFLEISDGDIPPRSMSLSSLSRLGLITISYFEYLRDQAAYEKFSIHPFYKGLQKYAPIGEISIKKGLVKLTPIGRSFVKVCVPD